MPVSSNGRPCALFLAPETPYPIAGGGALRSASVLEYLARDHHVDAIVFRQPEGPPPQFPSGLVRDVCVIPLPPNGRHPIARVFRNAERMVRRVPPLIDRFAGFSAAVGEFLRGRAYEIGFVEHFWCAPYWEQIAPHCRATVLDLHNIESVWHRRCGNAALGPKAIAHRVFHEASIRLERAWLPKYSLLLTASCEDATRVTRIAPAAHALVFPNAIPRIDLPHRPEEEAIVFSGSLDYDPNQAAVEYFRARIWPLLRERWPQLRWRLVGRNPEAVRQVINGDIRIECSGPVEDAVAHLAAAKAAVVPLLAGSGTRLKIIEAWAAGRAVVSTKLGAEGLPVRPGENILIEDDPARFAAAVSSLLQSPECRLRIGAAGRRLYEREFTWQAAWDQLRAALASLECSGNGVSGNGARAS